MNLKTVSFLFVMCVLISACQQAQIPSEPYELVVSNQDDILAGAVLTFPATVDMLNRIITGAAPSGSFIMELADDSYLFGFPWRNQFAILNLSRSGWEARHLGDMVRMGSQNPLTLSKTMNTFANQGGRYITHSQLPLTLVTEIQNLISWALRMGATLYNIPLMIFPFGSFNLDPACLGGCING